MSLECDMSKEKAALCVPPGYTVVRHFKRQGVRKSDMTPEWREEMRKKFGEIHGPFPTNPESIDFGDNVIKDSYGILILRDDETGIEEVIVYDNSDVDT